MLVRALAEPPLRDRTASSRSSPARRGAARSATSASCASSPRALGVADRVRLARLPRRRRDACSAPPTSSSSPRRSPTRCPTPRSRRPPRAAASSPPTTAGCRRSSRDGETGVLVAPRRPGRPRAGARRPRRRPGAPRARSRPRPRHDVRERFSPARLLDETQALYDRLTASRRLVVDWPAAATPGDRRRGGDARRTAAMPAERIPRRSACLRARGSPGRRRSGRRCGRRSRCPGNDEVKPQVEEISGADAASATGRCRARASRRTPRPSARRPRPRRRPSRRRADAAARRTSRASSEAK